MNLKNFKLSVILNSKRIIVYSQAEDWGKAKALVAEKLEVGDEDIRGARLSPRELDRIKDRRFKPNFSTDKNAKLMPLNKRFFMSDKELEEDKKNQEERKQKEIIAKAHALFGKDWELKGSQKCITDYYWMVRNDIKYNDMADHEMRNGFTLLEFLDSFVAGFEQPELKLSKEEEDYTFKMCDGTERTVRVRKVNAVEERNEIPLELHYKTTIQ